MAAAERAPLLVSSPPVVQFGVSRFASRLRSSSSGLGRPSGALFPASGGGGSPTSAGGTSSSAGSRSAAAARALLRGAWCQRFARLPLLPPSEVPPLFPLARLRHRTYLVLSDPYSSRAGLSVLIWNTLAVVAVLAAFFVSSFPQYRIRAARGFYDAPELAFDLVNGICAVSFLILFLLRLATLTAVPDLHESRALRAASAADAAGGRAPAPDFVDDDDAKAAAVGDAADDPLADALPGYLAFARSESGGADDAAEVSLLDLDGTTVLRLLGDGGPPPPLDAAGWPLAWSARAGCCCCCCCSGGAAARLRRRNAPRVARWLANVYNVVDLLTIIPFFAELGWLGEATYLSAQGAVLIRLLRFMCLLRLLRLASDTVTLRLLRRAVLITLDSLRGALLLVLISITLVSAAIFVAECGSFDAASGTFRRRNSVDDGTEESPFYDVPQALYWAVGTVTSTGYGDLVPTSAVGKLLAVATMAIGIFLLAIPATLVGFQFSLEHDAYRARVAIFKARRAQLRLEAEVRAAAAAAAAAAAGAEPATAGAGEAGSRRPRAPSQTASPLLPRAHSTLFADSAALAAGPRVLMRLASSAAMRFSPMAAAAAMQEQGAQQMADDAAAAAAAAADARADGLAQQLAAVQQEVRDMRGAVDQLLRALATRGGLGDAGEAATGGPAREPPIRAVSTPLE